MSKQDYASKTGSGEFLSVQTQLRDLATTAGEGSAAAKLLNRAADHLVPYSNYLTEAEQGQNFETANVDQGALRPLRLIDNAALAQAIRPDQHGAGALNHASGAESNTRFEIHLDDHESDGKEPGRAEPHFAEIRSLGTAAPAAINRCRLHTLSDGAPGAKVGQKVLSTVAIRHCCNKLPWKATANRLPG